MIVYWEMLLVKRYQNWQSRLFFYLFICKLDIFFILSVSTDWLMLKLICQCDVRHDKNNNVSFKIWTCIITSITACPIGWDINNNFFLDFQNWRYTIYYLMPCSRSFYSCIWDFNPHFNQPKSQFNIPSWYSGGRGGEVHTKPPCRWVWCGDRLIFISNLIT